MRILYLDCFSGISGDMTIGALLDAGGDFSHLENELKKLHIQDEYELKVKKVIKNGISSTKFDVILNDEHDHHHNHHHHEHEASQAEEHHHHHQGENNQDHHHHHEHRAYKDIVQLIEAADLPENVKDTSLKLFTKIGKAEGKIHGMPLDEVHFHEVGAVDSIIDIVGTAILIDQLEIDRKSVV